MPWYRPPREKLRSRIRSDFRYEFKNAAAALPGTIESGFVESLVGVSDGLHGRLDQVYRDAFPHLARGLALRRWGANYGLFMNRATYAEGLANAVGSNGTVVPVGTILTRADGFEYRTTAQVTWNAYEEKPVPVKARTPGESGNMLPGFAFLTFGTTIVGALPQLSIEAPGLTGGSDAETETNFLARILEELDQPPSGGGPGDYKRWAKLVTGVTRVWEFGNTPSIGHVTVLAMRDNDDTPFPSDPELAEIKAKIEEFSPINLAGLHVLKPIAAPIDIHIELTTEPNAVESEVKAAVVQRLRDMVAVRSSPPPDDDHVFFKSWINEAISGASGELDHKVLSPAGDITLAQWELVTLGSVMWA